MSNARYARASRSRFMLYFACLLGGVGLIVIYHNTLTQLDVIKKSNEVCHQQQEALSAQLQVIFEYKNRLEKNLQTLKLENEKSRSEMAKRFENEKAEHQKVLMENNLKYTSLQKQYDSLKIERDEAKRKIDSIEKEKVLSENKLKESERKLSDVQIENKKLKSDYFAQLAEKDKIKDNLNLDNFNKNELESQINHLLKENYQLKKSLKAERFPRFDDSNKENIPPNRQDSKNVLVQPNIGSSSSRNYTSSTQSSINREKQRAAVPIQKPDEIHDVPNFIMNKNINLINQSNNIPSGVVPMPFDDKENFGENKANVEVNKDKLENKESNQIENIFDDKKNDENKKGNENDQMEDKNVGAEVDQNQVNILEGPINADKTQHVKAGGAQPPNYDYDRGIDKDPVHPNEEEDDDGDEYHMARQNDPAERN